MPLSATQINKEIKKKPDKEKWISLERGSSCYLVVKRQSARFIGKTNIGSPSGEKYSVVLGSWMKDFTSPYEVLEEWNEMKTWGLKKNCDVRKYAERLTLNKSDMTLKEVCDEYLRWKSGHVAASTLTTQRNRLNQILQYLPDGILADDLSGSDGTKLIKKIVLDPSIQRGVPYTAQRHRKLLNQVFEYAVSDDLIEEKQMPLRLDKQLPFEKNIKSNKHPHLDWNEFRNNFIPDLNRNSCGASRLTELSTKALLLMLTRASVVVSMEWNWYDDKTNCWIIPASTEGLKRKTGDDKNDHYIPNTLQLERLMNHLHAINGDQKYVFFSPYKGNHPYVSKQTPNDHLINLGYKGKQDAHGFRHVATNALIDIGHKDDLMVSRCLGHLKQQGVMRHYNSAKQLDERKEIHSCWNQLLIDEGLRI